MDTRITPICSAMTRASQRRRRRRTRVCPPLLHADTHARARSCTHAHCTVSVRRRLAPHERTACARISVVLRVLLKPVDAVGSSTTSKRQNRSENARSLCASGANCGSLTATTAISSVGRAPVNAGTDWAPFSCVSTPPSPSPLNHD